MGPLTGVFRALVLAARSSPGFRSFDGEFVARGCSTLPCVQVKGTERWRKPEKRLRHNALESLRDRRVEVRQVIIEGPAQPAPLVPPVLRDDATAGCTAARDDEGNSGHEIKGQETLSVVDSL